MAASEITTVIPYFNGSKTLSDCLASIGDELLPSREVIIVNDGSSDDEVERLNQIVARSNQTNIRVVHQVNSGQGGARNKGVECSETSFVAFLDQDDRVHPCHNKILHRALLQAKENNPLTLYASGDVRQINERSEVVCNGVCRRNRKHSLDDAMELVSTDLFILPGATLVDRLLFLRLGGFDPRLRGYEDDDLFLRAYRKGYAGILLEDEVCDWRIHSASTSYSVAMMESRFYYFCKLLDFFPDDPFQSRMYSEAIWRRFGYWFKHDYLKALAAVKDSPSSGASHRLSVAASILKEANQIKRDRVYGPSTLIRLINKLSPLRISLSRFRVLSILQKDIRAFPSVIKNLIG